MPVVSPDGFVASRYRVFPFKEGRARWIREVGVVVVSPQVIGVVRPALLQVQTGLEDDPRRNLPAPVGLEAQEPGFLLVIDVQYPGGPIVVEVLAVTVLEYPAPREEWCGSTGSR